MLQLENLNNLALDEQDSKSNWFSRHQASVSMGQLEKLWKPKCHFDDKAKLSTNLYY